MTGQTHGAWSYWLRSTSTAKLVIPPHPDQNFAQWPWFLPHVNWMPWGQWVTPTIQSWALKWYIYCHKRHPHPPPLLPLYISDRLLLYKINRYALSEGQGWKLIGPPECPLPKMSQIQDISLINDKVGPSAWIIPCLVPHNFEKS